MAIALSTAGDFLQQVTDISMESLLNVTPPETSLATSTSSSAISESIESAVSTAMDQEHVEYLQQLERVVSIVVPIFFSIVVFVGLFGNLLVVLVVSFNKQMRNTTNLLILNLAVADILFIVFCVPFSAAAYALPHNWLFGDAWCKIWQFLIVATAFVSIYTLVLMSLDRFLAVVYPVESMTWRTEANCRIAITLTWVLTVMFCTPLIFSHGEVVPPDTEHSYCIFLDNQTISFLPESWDARWSKAAFYVTFFLTSYVLPLLLICGLYSVMLCRLWNQAPGGRASAESIKNKKRVIKMVLIVIVIFALCWLPIHTILVLRSFGLYFNTPMSLTLQIISAILAYSNSCVNPILYAFLSEPFRRGFWAVITCIRPSGPHGMGQTTAETLAARQRARDKTHANTAAQAEAAAAVPTHHAAQPMLSTQITLGNGEKKKNGVVSAEMVTLLQPQPLTPPGISIVAHSEEIVRAAGCINGSDFV